MQNRCPFVFLSLFFVTTPSLPQDSADILLNLEQVTVTAMRSEVRAIDSPAAVLSLDNAKLRMRQQVRTTPESLRAIPGVMVQRTGHGQGSPYIRGFTGFRTLLLIDGIRLNNSTFREGPNQYLNTVDPYLIGSLELVKGPISVLYGSDAIGGAVNALTLDHSKLSSGPLQPSLLYRYSSAEDSSIVRVEGSRALENGAGVTAGLSLKRFGDLGSAAGTQQHTGYSERDFDIKLTADTQRSQWTFAHQNVHVDDAWRTHPTVFAQSFAGTTIGDEKRRSLNQRRSLSYLRYRHTAIGRIGEPVITVSHQLQKEDRYRIRANDRADWQGTVVNTFGIALDTSTEGHWQYGLEYYHDRVDSFRRDFNSDGTLRSVRIQGPVADDASYGMGGLYVQKQLDTGAIAWTVGGRYTQARADAQKVEDPQSGIQTAIRDNWRSVVGSLRALYRPEQAMWAVFGGISQAFRAPNLSDLTRLDTARSNELEVPSAGLEPEDYLNYELGFRLDVADWKSQVTVFHTEIDQLITRTPTGRTIDDQIEVAKINSGDGYVQGFEAELNYRVNNAVQFFTAFTWVDGEALAFPTSAPVGAIEPLDRLMPTTLVSGLRWNSPHKDHWAELEMFHVADADRLSTRDQSDSQRIPPGGTPGYTVAHLRGGWAFSNRINVAVALENLTNRNYRIHGSGLNEAGRNLIVTLNWHPDRQHR